MATLTISSNAYYPYHESRGTATASFTDDYFGGGTDVPSWQPVGWSEGTLNKCRFGVEFDVSNVDWSTITNITAATLNVEYYVPSPQQWVNTTTTISRTVNFRRATSNIDSSGWAYSNNSTSTGAATLTISGSKSSGTALSTSILTIVNAWKSASATYCALSARMSNDSSDQYAPAAVTSGSNTQYAAGFAQSMSITITYTIAPAAPSAQVQGGQTADCSTVGSTTSIKTFDAGTTSSGNMRFSFVDDNEPDGDYCSQYTIEVYTNSGFTGSPVHSDVIVTSGSPQGIITYSLSFSKVPKDTDLFWRVKVADTNPGAYGAFTNLTRGSGASQVISKFRVDTGSSTPPPSGGGGGNPNYTSVTTFARNKFRIEFYQIADTITPGLELSNADANPNIAPSFNPTPVKDAAGN